MSNKEIDLEKRNCKEEIDILNLRKSFNLSFWFSMSQKWYINCFICRKTNAQKRMEKLAAKAQKTMSTTMDIQ
jgi:hypothetical protein